MTYRECVLEVARDDAEALSEALFDLGALSVSVEDADADTSNGCEQTIDTDGSDPGGGGNGGGETKSGGSDGGCNQAPVGPILGLLALLRYRRRR